MGGQGRKCLERCSGVRMKQTGSKPPSAKPARRTRLPPAMRELMLACSCVSPDKSSTYISGPITTGKRFLDWYTTSGYRIPRTSARYRIELDRNVCVQNERE